MVSTECDLADAMELGYTATDWTINYQFDRVGASEWGPINFNRVRVGLVSLQLWRRKERQLDRQFGRQVGEAVGRRGL